MSKLITIIILFLLLASCTNKNEVYVRNVEVKNYKGRQTIFVNGKPESAVIYTLTDCPGGRWTWEEFPKHNLELFTQQGFRLFQVSIWFNDIWTPDGKMDITQVQKQLRGVLDVNPDAVVIIRLHINAPFWWNEQNPNECTQYADGPSDEHPKLWSLVRNTTLWELMRPKIHSLASLKWKNEITEKLIEFCKRLASTPEGNAVGGLNICDGVSHEWHYWGFIEHDPDTGSAMTSAFRVWLKEKYKDDKALQQAWNNDTIKLTSAVVPGMKERNTLSDGIFRDPQKERYVIDYLECQHTIVANDVIHFCKTAKENWPRKIMAGAFYGYFFMLFNRQAEGGHLEMDRVLESPYIDFLSAPQSYWYQAREMGGSGQSRAVLKSYLLNNKLSLEEMDQSTQFGGLFEKYSFMPKVKADSIIQDDIAIIRRNTLRPFVEGVGMWYYDFGPKQSSGWWDNPSYQAEIGQLKRIVDKYREKEYSSPSDVLVVFDTKCYYQFKNSWNAISEKSIDESSAMIYRCGVASDFILLKDLPKADLKKYKAIVFANCWLIDQEMKTFIKEKVSKEGRHILWTYMPGYSDGNRLNIDYVNDITGFSLEKIKYDQKPGIVNNNKSYPPMDFELQDKLEPLPIINDKDAEIIGHLKGTIYNSVGKKIFSTYTSWYSSVPWIKTDMLRKIFIEAGCHIYQDQNDALFAGAGLVGICTKSGGDKSIKLSNGKEIKISVRPGTTIIIDAETGEVLLK